jgi:hypothetical protein
MTEFVRQKITGYLHSAEELLSFRKLAVENLDSLSQKLMGMRFGSLTISSPIRRRKTSSDRRRGTVRFLDVTCLSCGDTYEIYLDNLLFGKTTTCRCQTGRKWAGDKITQKAIERYSAMDQRCNNPLNGDYFKYGARGIKLLISKKDFIEWFVAESKKVVHLRRYDIDRIDNNGHYELSNIRLVSPAENSRNKRTSHFVDYKGQKIAVCDYPKYFRRDYPDFTHSDAWLIHLASRGLSVEEILVRPREAYVVSRSSQMYKELKKQRSQSQ